MREFTNKLARHKWVIMSNTLGKRAAGKPFEGRVICESAGSHATVNQLGASRSSRPK